jgi:hypothetical protein
MDEVKIRSSPDLAGQKGDGIRQRLGSALYKPFEFHGAGIWTNICTYRF